MSSCFLLCIVFAVTNVEAIATLFNGSQAAVLPTTTSTTCLAAFNTSLNCDQTQVQLLPYSDDAVGWTTSTLNLLCPTTCQTSLSSLRSTVASSCGTSYFSFNNGNMSYTDIVDYYIYKWGLTCLKDSSANKYCLDVESSWNIPSMVAAGSATWPKYTAKTYPDFSVDDWSPQVDVSGNLLPVSVIFPYHDPTTSTIVIQTSTIDPAAADYFVARPTAVADTNYGWGELDQDEYPLQIQCSACHLNRIVYTMSSVWGDIYDEMTSQVWSNIQKNCAITTNLAPANNLTGQGYNLTYIDPTFATTMNATGACARYITPASSATSCNAFALANSIPTKSLLRMNGLNCVSLGNPPYCAPLACSIAVNPTFQPTMNFVGTYTNFTLYQFKSWNPWINLEYLDAGEVVCVGPPGGAFVPATASQASPTVFTTTAKPAAPTVSGTFKSCGLYYNVTSGDYCNAVCLKFSLTFNQFIGMNPSVNCACTNLYLGYDYCVAPVNGTTIPSATCTSATTTPTPTSTSTSTKPTTSSTTTTKPTTTATCGATTAPPAPTTSGSSTACCKWYTVQSGDSCYSVETAFGITSAQFLAWNTQVDAGCGNLFLGYAYCVGA